MRRSRMVLALAVSACVFLSPSAPAGAAGNREASVLARMVEHRHGDIARAALSTEAYPPLHSEIRKYVWAFGAEASSIRKSPTPNTFAALNAHFFGPRGFTPSNDLAGPENTSFAAVLDRRRGTCIGLAIAYLALAQRLGLDAHGVATPAHVFVRVALPDGPRNVEFFEQGSHVSDDSYRRRYRIDEASVAAGVFLRDLTNAEVVAHLVTNQAVALSERGQPDAALARYDAALILDPQLTAAWYNRGLDLMKAGRFSEALTSLDKDIELYPSDAQAHNNRGLVKMRLNDPDGARADFERALQIEPEMREAKENLDAMLRGR